MSSTSHAPEAVAGAALAAPAAGKSYIFAVVSADQPQPHDCLGIDGRPLATVREGRLAAIICTVDGPRIRPERRHLAVHQAVLKRLLADTTPLPLSFGMVADHPAAIRKFLHRHQHAFVEQLQHLDGKVEMGVRVTWDVPNIFEYFVNTHAELREARDRLVGGNRPPTQEEKIELGRMFERLLGEDRDSHTAEVERRLAGACFDVKANPCRSEREVMNLACLVARPAQEEFGNAVFQAARIFDNNFAFDYSGPWAPHNFVEIERSL